MYNMAESAILDGRVFCLITGASKGFGRASAVSFAKYCNFTEGSMLLITGRDKSGLEETKSLVQHLNSKIDVQIEVFDLEDIPSVQSFSSKLHDVKQNFDLFVLLNNAGSLGDITKRATSPISYETMKGSFDANVFSVMLLVQCFCSAFKPGKKMIIHVSSLAAIKPTEYMSLYCITKAAREMLHRIIACEETDIRVLNYSPGPLETAMSMNLQDNCGNKSVREFFKQLRDTNTIIDPEMSAKKMIQVLKEDKYVSGDHIDFYDIE